MKVQPKSAAIQVGDVSQVGVREGFEASGLNRIGLSYDEIRCEGYFYDALLQAVTGDAVTRSARLAKIIQEVLETRAGHYYEYLMARYLRSRG
jgi:hypothetical protein